MKAENVYTGQLDTLKGEINNYTLFAAGLVSSPYVKVKLVTKGELTKSVDVHLQAASNSAIAAIEKAGGSFKVVGRPMRESKKTKS